MSRLQSPISLPNVVVGVAGTATPLAGSQTFAKSIFIQGIATNTGLIRVGFDSTNMTIELSAGRGVTLQGDNSDNGTTAKLDLSQVYITSTINGEAAAVAYMPDI